MNCFASYLKGNLAVEGMLSKGNIIVEGLLNVLLPKTRPRGGRIENAGLDATAASCVTTMRAPLLFALAAAQLCDALSATTPIKLHVEFCQQ